MWTHQTPETALDRLKEFVVLDQTGGVPSRFEVGGVGLQVRARGAEDGEDVGSGFGDFVFHTMDGV